MHLYTTRGVTLVEVLMVTVIVLGLVGALLFVIGNAGQKAWTGTEALLVNLTQAQAALDRMSDEVRGACASSPTVPWICGANQLQFTRPPTCDQSVTYSLAGNTLTRQVDPEEAPTDLTGGLNEFRATCTTDGSPVHLVDLQVTAEATSGTYMRPQTLQSQVWVANP